MQNNHYVPCFILRSFEKNIDLFNLDDGSFKKSLAPYQAPYWIQGLYPDDLENRLSVEVESFFLPSIETLSSSNDPLQIKNA